MLTMKLYFPALLKILIELSLLLVLKGLSQAAGDCKDSKKMSIGAFHLITDKQQGVIVSNTTIEARCTAFVGKAGSLEFVVYRDGNNNLPSSRSNEGNKRHNFRYIEERKPVRTQEGCHLRSTATISYTAKPMPSRDAEQSIVCKIKDGPTDYKKIKYVVKEGPTKPQMSFKNTLRRAEETFTVRCSANVGVGGLLTWLLEAGNHTVTWRVDKSKEISIDKGDSPVCAAAEFKSVSFDDDKRTTITSILKVVINSLVEHARISCFSFMTSREEDQERFKVTHPPLQVSYVPERPHLVLHYHKAHSVVHAHQIFRAECSSLVGTQGELQWQLANLASTQDEPQTCSVKAGPGQKPECEAEHTNFKITSEEAPVPTEERKRVLGPYIKSRLEMNVTFFMDQHYIRCTAKSGKTELSVISLPLVVQERQRTSYGQITVTTEFLRATAMFIFFIAALSVGTVMLTHKLAGPGGNPTRAVYGDNFSLLDHGEEQDFTECSKKVHFNSDEDSRRMEPDDYDDDEEKGVDGDETSQSHASSGDSDHSDHSGHSNDSDDDDHSDHSDSV